MTSTTSDECKDGPRKSADAASVDGVVHKDVVCDGCGATPIFGTRWRCSICKDFDLCSDCDAKKSTGAAAGSTHKLDHPMIRFTEPALSVQQQALEATKKQLKVFDRKPHPAQDAMPRSRPVIR